MELEILRKIGLTDGEIKVYSALVELGKAPIFKIMKNSRVSSSKVYLILDKLIQKGFVSFGIENGTKNFEITNPNAVLDYVNKKKEELNGFNKDFESIIAQIMASKGSFKLESAQVYTGVKGIGAAFENLLEEMQKGEEYYFFSITPDELTSKNMDLFFKNYHNKRIEKGVSVKGIVHPLLSKSFLKEVLHKDYSIKHYELTLPTGAIIGKNRVIISLWGEQNICYEIISKRVAEKYRLFFEKIWEIAN
jgi:sugar-specific transcriptional regulator TrmB